MPDGCVLEILTTRRRRSRLGYGQFAEIRFRDNGIGIARDKLKKLFIPFYTTKSRGTGLGLAISQRIVAQHNGTIEVRSTPGQGSTFSVFLPAIPAAAATLPPLSPHTQHTDDDFEEITSEVTDVGLTPPPLRPAETLATPDPDPDAGDLPPTATVTG
jgi:hypothetical protein